MHKAKWLSDLHRTCKLSNWIQNVFSLQNSILFQYFICFVVRQWHPQFWKQYWVIWTVWFWFEETKYFISNFTFSWKHDYINFAFKMAFQYCFSKMLKVGFSVSWHFPPKWKAVNTDTYQKHFIVGVNATQPRKNSDLKKIWLKYSDWQTYYLRPTCSLSPPACGDGAGFLFGDRCNNLLGWCHICHLLCSHYGYVAKAAVVLHALYSAVSIPLPTRTTFTILTGLCCLWAPSLVTSLFSLEVSEIPCSALLLCINPAMWF